ncbi:MAG: RNA polymerase sigma factor [Verrucomicrobiia bacterium]
MNLSEQEILQALLKARTRLSAAAWMVVRDTHAAEDIFQNVTLKAMTRGICFETEAALTSWAIITARREGLDWLRRHQREVLGFDPEIYELLDRDWQAAPAHPPGARLEALRDCLAAAPESARHLLRLRYVDGYSCEEVAEKMRLTLSAVYKRLSRLHEQLRQCVEGKLTGTGETV